MTAATTRVHGSMEEEAVKGFTRRCFGACSVLDWSQMDTGGLSASHYITHFIQEAIVQDTHLLHASI